MEGNKVPKRSIIISLSIIFVIAIGFFINYEMNANSNTTTSVLKPFYEAEKYKGEGKYRQALESYKQVTQNDKDYNAAQEKIKECIKLYIDDQINYAKKTVSEEKNYPAAISMINSGLEVDPNNKELLALKDEYTAAYKKAEDERMAKFKAQFDNSNQNKNAVNMQPPKTSNNTDKENMGKYESGNSLIGVAITQTRKDGVYLWLDVCAINLSNKTQHVNPNDFTLSTLSGNTVNYDNKTFSSSKYFDGINLNPQNQTSGWLAFNVSSNEKQFILHYNGFTGKVDKKIILD
jgi:tetratricopeptide (TPR) repeat protein